MGYEGGCGVSGDWEMICDRGFLMAADLRRCTLIRQLPRFLGFPIGGGVFVKGSLLQGDCHVYTMVDSNEFGSLVGMV